MRRRSESFGSNGGGSPVTMSSKGTDRYTTMRTYDARRLTERAFDHEVAGPPHPIRLP